MRYQYIVADNGLVHIYTFGADSHYLCIERITDIGRQGGDLYTGKFRVTEQRTERARGPVTDGPHFMEARKRYLRAVAVWS